MPSFFDSRHDAGTVIISEDHVSGFLADFGAGYTHGYTDIRPLHGWCVVDTITGNCHDFAVFLATCPRKSMRDPARALRVAGRLLEVAGRRNVVGTVRLWCDDRGGKPTATAQGTYALPL